MTAPDTALDATAAGDTPVLRPRDAADVAEAVAGAVAAGRRLEVIGHGSKRDIGPPVAADAVLDLSGLAGVALYEPEELVLSAGAGTALADIEALIGQRGQCLAFEPMDYGPVLGLPPGRGTLGGLAATNLSGPRRFKAGAARDHVLGVAAVSGRGEAFRAGGRVVKNVTGYDLARGLVGSWGTLAALTEVTLKVLPQAESEATVVVVEHDIEEACRTMRSIVGSSIDVSGAALVPKSLAGRLPELDGLPVADVALYRLEGIEVSIAERLVRLEKAAGRFEVVMEQGPSRRLWRALRDVEPLAPAPGLPVDEVPALWRVCIAPTAGAWFAEALHGSAGMETMLDWGGALLWVAVPAEHTDCGAAAIRAAVRQAGGGHATLIRAPAARRAAIPVFEPQNAGVAELSRRLKEQFDPKGVLSPGRMG